MRLACAGVLLAAAAAACGGDDKGTSTSSSGGLSSGSTSGGETSSGAPEESGSGAATPQVAGPKIVSVMKMTGSLHVTWELPAKCDGVELERKDGDGAFKVVYELPGTVDNKHDGKATSDMKYTYRARCTLGSDYTEYSNEMSGNPQQ